METVKAFFLAAAAFFGWKSKKLDADNTPEMQARGRALTDQEVKDGAAAAVADGDLNKIRKDLAE